MSTEEQYKAAEIAYEKALIKFIDATIAHYGLPKSKEVPKTVLELKKASEDYVREHTQ